MSSAPSFLAWKPAVAAATSAFIANYSFVNNGGPGDTLSDTLGTAAAITGLTASMDTYVVQQGDRVLLQSQIGATPSAEWQDGIYVATKIASVFGVVATLGAITQPTGTLTNGIFRNVATTSSGSGTGALVDITVSGGVVSAVALSNVYSDSPGMGGPVGGSGYAAADTIVFPANFSGSTSTAGHTVVSTLSPAFVLTRSPDNNTSQLMPGFTVFVANGATNAGKAYVQTVNPVTLDVVSQISSTGAIVQPTATSFFPIVNGTYTNVSLTGGHGSGAGATITVAGGVVTVVTVTSVGSGYLNGDVLGFSAVTGSYVWGLGTAGTVVVNTSVPASSLVNTEQLV